MPPRGEYKLAATRAKLTHYRTRRDNIPGSTVKVHPSKTNREAVLLLLLSLCPAAALARERETPAAQVTINTGRAGCTVELDAAPAGKTDAQGRLVLSDVEATDHYLHVRCPDDAQETAYLVSPRLGENAQIRHGT